MSDSISDFGGAVLLPIMPDKNVSKDLNINTRLGIYAPTGSYETGRLAYTGKNF